MPRYEECLPALRYAQKKLHKGAKTLDYYKFLAHWEPSLESEDRESLTAFRRYRMDQRKRIISKFLGSGIVSSEPKRTESMASKTRTPVETLKENRATFMERLSSRLAPSDLVRVEGAYYLAKFGHRSQTRMEPGPDGKPLRYFEHVRRVALLVMDKFHCYDPDIICTALLHDTLEDTNTINAAIIEQFFGREVARRVRLLTKAPKEGYLDRLIQADPMTRFVKICDRLDNLRSLPQDPAFREKTLRETHKYAHAFLQEGERSPLYLQAEKALLKVLEDFSREGGWQADAYQDLLFLIRHVNYQRRHQLSDG